MSAPQIPGRPLPRAASPLVLQFCRIGGKDVFEPFADEGAGYAAWRDAIRDVGMSYASLIRTSGPLRDRWLCEWTRQGGFCDRTDGHRCAIIKLCNELSASTSEACALVSGGDVRFEGVTGTHNLGGYAFNTEERVRAHWAGFVSAGSTS